MSYLNKSFSFPFLFFSLFFDIESFKLIYVFFLFVCSVFCLFPISFLGMDGGFFIIFVVGGLQTTLILLVNGSVCLCMGV